MVNVNDIPEDLKADVNNYAATHADFNVTDGQQEISTCSDDIIRVLAVDGIRRLNAHIQAVFIPLKPVDCTYWEKSIWLYGTMARFIKAILQADSKTRFFRYVVGKEDGVQIGDIFIPIPNCTPEIADSLRWLAIWPSTDALLQALLNKQLSGLRAVQEMIDKYGKDNYPSTDGVTVLF